MQLNLLHLPKGIAVSASSNTSKYNNEKQYSNLTAVSSSNNTIKYNFCQLAKWRKWAVSNRRITIKYNTSCAISCIEFTISSRVIKSSR